MKKIFIQLFLLMSLSIFSNQKETIIELMKNYYIGIGQLIHVYSREKKDFKEKMTSFAGKKDYKDLVLLMKKYIEKYPDESFAYEQLGYYYDFQDNYEEAEKYYLKSIELSNVDTGIYSLCLLYYDQGREKEAEKYIKKINHMTHEKLKEIRAHKTQAMLGNPYSLFRLALEYSNTGRYKLAEKYALEALKIAKEEKSPHAISDIKDLLKKIRNSRPIM